MKKLAYVFPGQGSQSVGMLAELAEHYPLIIETFHHVSHSLGYDVWQLVQQGPESVLNQTEKTQVTMLTADVALFRLLDSLGLTKARVMAGHSLGEYAALVCANAINLTDAAKLVEKRGQLMQEAVPRGLGAMAAVVGLTDEQVRAICAQASTENEVVTPANFNAIGQVVIAGHTPAIERAIDLANQQEARLAKIIPVSVPCHCPLLNSAALAFEEFLAITEFKKPEIPIISNVDLSSYQSPEQIRSLLKEQLYRPVRWVEIIQLITSSYDVEIIIESGPGRVLSGLIKRIDRSLSVMSVCDKLSLEQLLSHVQR